MRRNPACFAGWCVAMGALLPFSGFVNGVVSAERASDTPAGKRVSEAASSPAPAVEAPLQRCMPGLADYTSMWWANGSPAGPNRRGKGRPHANENQILCFQTGRYGLAMDAKTVRLLNLGRLGTSLSEREELTSDQTLIRKLPPGDMKLSVMVDGKRYHCVSGANLFEDPLLDWPVRQIDSGTFVQRADIQNLVFEDDEGNVLQATGRLEIVAWPDLLKFILEIVPRQNFKAGQSHIQIRYGGKEFSSPSSPPKPWEKNGSQRVSVGLFPDDSGRSEPRVPAEDVAEISMDGKPVPVIYDENRGWYQVNLPDLPWDGSSPEAELDRLHRIRVRLKNPTDHELVVRLLFSVVEPGSFTGFTPMLRDGEGNPTGIPVQLSKNWHNRHPLKTLYEGPWFHGFTMLRLPARSSTHGELSICHGRWGGVPAASHAQLCVIGYAHNQLWNQVAIGAWGESICYEPDGVMAGCMIADVRPILVRKKDGRKWEWGGNVGGGDFLMYIDDQGCYQYFIGMRTQYSAHGPNLTSASFAGLTADGKIRVAMDVSTPRSDDILRCYHHLRYDVLKTTPFNRLAFYQLPSDYYHGSVSGKIAVGNESGLIEEWKPVSGGNSYSRIGIACKGNVPWLSLHEPVFIDDKSDIEDRVCRGLVIRSWKARLGGKEIASPFVSVYGRSAGGNENYPVVELSPPPGLTQLQAGDFVEADVELVVVPSKADQYYGPNQNLQHCLETGGNTWKPVMREAVGNRLNIQAKRGEMIHRYPLVVRVDAQQSAEFEVTGGIGYVPITLTGLDDFQGYGLWREVDGKYQPVDQSIHGKDFWQTNYDAQTRRWRMTYNVPLDTVEDQPLGARFFFGRTPPLEPGVARIKK